MSLLKVLLQVEAQDRCGLKVILKRGLVELGTEEMVDLARVVEAVLCEGQTSEVLVLDPYLLAE